MREKYWNGPKRIEPSEAYVLRVGWVGEFDKPG